MAEWRRRARAPSRRSSSRRVATRAPRSSPRAAEPPAERSCGCPRRRRGGRDSSRPSRRLRHPAPVVNVAARPGPCDGDSPLAAALTVAADGAALWTRTPSTLVGGTTDDRAFFQALTIQTEPGPATDGARPTCDLLAARWISTASGEYAAGIGQDGVVRVWRCVGVDGGFGDGPASRRGRPTLASGPRLVWGTKATSRG